MTLFKKALAAVGLGSDEIEVKVERGYHPNKIEVSAGEPIRLRFLRRETSGCSREVVFPALGVRQTLPHLRHEHDAREARGRTRYALSRCSSVNDAK